jgi:hypothetical protein
MTNSGLIIFLPLVTAFVGAIIGAWANSWYRGREAKKAEEEERKGLLLLVHAEIQYNNYLLDEFLERWPATTYDSSATLQTATWDDAKVKLVPLLTEEHTTALILYYWQIQSILDVVKDESLTEDRKGTAVWAYGGSARKHGEAVTRNSARYVSLGDLDYTEVANKAFAEEDE